MKILIISDTHGADQNVSRVLKAEEPVDMMIHLGDIEGTEERLRRMPGIKTAVCMVRGNNDFFSQLEREQEISIGPHKALLVHGHQYGVSMGTEVLREEAIARGCDMAMFGHTHRPFYKKEGGVAILNPGSLSFPRQEGRTPSYIIMEMQDNGEYEVFIKYIRARG